MKDIILPVNKIIKWCIGKFYFPITRMFTSRRFILFYGYNTMNYIMFKSLHHKIEDVSNTMVFFRLGLTSEDNTEPYIQLGVPKKRILSHDEASKRKWDAAIGADMPRPWLRWSTIFIQIGHGVAAKRVTLKDENGNPVIVDYRYHPELKKYDIVFFPNETDFSNAKRLNALKNFHTGDVVGMCCLDEMMSFTSADNTERLKNKYVPLQFRDKKILLYAPTWDTTASFKQMGLEIIEFLSNQDFFVIIKPHPLCITSQVGNTGKELSVLVVELFPRGNCVLVTGSPYEVMAISDLIISDFSSITFEYSLLRRPIHFYEGIDYLEKVADMEQYNLIRACCYVYNNIYTLYDNIKLNDYICDKKRTKMIQLQAEYLANVGFSTEVAVKKLIEHKIIIINKCLISEPRLN